MATGQCLCGGIKFEAAGKPRWVAYCHCASCRRHTASPITCFVNFRTEDVRFSGTPATYESSPGVTRSFCRNCGTPIAYQTAKRSDEIDIYVNVFDEPERYPPDSHVFYAEHVPWLDVHDDLPRK